MKVCKYGNHPISDDEVAVTFFESGLDDDPVTETYACAPCDELFRVRQYIQTGILTSNLIVSAVLQRERRSIQDAYAWFDGFNDDLDAVALVGKDWERQVWFGGTMPHRNPKLTHATTYGFRAYKSQSCKPRFSLQGFVSRAPYKGYQARVGSTTYLSYTMCGRSIFHAERADGPWIEMIEDEDSPTACGGIRSIFATRVDAINLLKSAITDFQQGRIVWVKQASVGFGF